MKPLDKVAWSGRTHVINHTAEADCDVPKRDDDVTPHNWIFASLEDLEQQKKV